MIIKVGETDLTTDNVGDMIESVVGEEGTKISIVVRRDKEDLPAMELTCRAIDVPTVTYRMLSDTSNNTVGYIRIKSFGTATSDQFSEAMNSAIGDNSSALILDLRNTVGGNARAVAQILDRLLPAGDLYSVTYGNGTTTVMAVSDEDSTNLPITVLVNKNTSGYAELFAQIIKDYGKGQIIGEKTAGNGSLQEIFELTDGSAVSLTIGVFNTPKNVQFNKVGIEPDYVVALDELLYEYVGQLDTFDDPQLAKALEIAEAQIKALLYEMEQNGETTDSEDYSAEESLAANSSEEMSSEAESSEESAEGSEEESEKEDEESDSK